MTYQPSPESTESLIYEHTRQGPARQLASVDAIDAKAIQVFAAASVVLGFGTFTASTMNAGAAILYAGAAGAYFGVGWHTKHVVTARDYRVTDGADRWWPTHGAANTAVVRGQILDDIATAFSENRLPEGEGRPFEYRADIRGARNATRRLFRHRGRALSAAAT